jgi:hypothetical protein
MNERFEICIALFLSIVSFLFSFLDHSITYILSFFLSFFFFGGGGRKWWGEKMHRIHKEVNSFRVNDFSDGFFSTELSS